ncbi:cation diffusion facilitator family transporter [Psychromonas sp.]|uniref:cation diffusion facilitator family transporter n=1 Tax=Psychromonas sp. TaxID=1884585 RepID=UPI0039E4C696
MSHDHSHSPQEYGKLFAIGIALNISYVAIEAFYGWRIESLALLADAGHNLGDVAGLLLAWAALAAGKILPNRKHTFGWKKASIFASFVNATILLTAMGALAWEAISRLGQDSPTQASTIIWVAGVGVLINALTAWLFIKGSKEDLNIRGAFLHMAADALVSLAVVISAALYLQWQWQWLDPVMSLLVAAVVVIGTWSLFIKSLHLLFDGVPVDINTRSIINYFNNHPHIYRFHDLHIWAISTTENSLSVHLVKEDESIENSSLLTSVNKDIHDQYKIFHTTIQIETKEFSRQCASEHCTDY